MGNINNFKMMKFVLSMLVAGAAATEGEACGADETVCTDEGACCGYMVDAVVISRVCSGAAGAAPADKLEEQVFSCEDPNDTGDEGAAKIAVGTASLLAALYML